MSDMQAVAAEWLAARAVVIRFLQDLMPNRSLPDVAYECYADALLARLASADPPLLVCTGRACSAEADRLRLELAGAKKAYDLLLAGMGSACEGRDELKHEARGLARERDDALAELEDLRASAARVRRLVVEYEEEG